MTKLFVMEFVIIFRMKFCDPKRPQSQPEEILQQDENLPPNISSNPDDKSNPVPLPEEQNYRGDIEAYVISSSTPPAQPVNYFPQQQDLSQHMRGILLSWLLEVHQKYKLMSQTFFLTVKIVDSFLKRQNIPRNKLQLVGVASLWIAAKYQETYQVPKLKNLQLLCDNAYKAADILTMEGKILEMVGFQILTESTALNHFELIKHHAQLAPKDYWLARYLLEASVFDLGLQRFSPALLAYAMVFFLKKMRGYQIFNQSSLRPLVQGSDHQIRVISRQLCSLWHRAEQQDCLSPLRLKYSNKQFYEVSKIRLTERSK